MTVSSDNSGEISSWLWDHKYLLPFKESPGSKTSTPFGDYERVMMEQSSINWASYSEIS